MMVSFPFNWFWLADDGRVFDSERQKISTDKDAHYLAWVRASGNATRWPENSDGVQSDEALELVIGEYGMTCVQKSFAELKAEFKTQIDQTAETERLKYITPGNGQAMTYQQKVAEAQSFKAATNPQENDYPILSSEVGITAETLGEVADIVLAAFAQWQQIGAMIESIRLGAKRDVDAANDEAAVRAVVDAIEWPQPAL